MKIVVVGSGGRLGAALARELGSDHQVVGFRRKDLDLTSPETIRKMLGDLDFDLLLTPAALTQVDYCEDHVEEAMAVNAMAPGVMAEVAKEKGARMIHFGTDYVFDGKDPEPRKETDPINPLGVYGLSKAEGERAVLAVSEDFVVARVSWVFGPDRPSFLDSIIAKAMEVDEVSAIADKYSSPTFSNDLAKLVSLLIDRPCSGGLLNMCNSGSCSWQEYAQVGIDAALACGVPLRAKQVDAISLEQMGFQAPRPKYTAMSVDRLTQICGQCPRPWQEAVNDYVRRFVAT
ncbi:MAG: dTDP-4-dehydrorhamnose reductase [Verrucomicrobiaceae bacterium]|nr:dTDP-4-dehydrorhamnose reductase [Verrucomicrobiaceae bacterium]